MEKTLKSNFESVYDYQLAFFFITTTYTHCDDFHESSPCALIYLNTWSTVGEIVWEELVGVTFLEEVSLGLGFWALKTTCQAQCHCLPAPFRSDMSTRILSNYHVCLHHNDHCLTLQNYKQAPNKMFPFITSLGHAVSSHNSNPN